MMSNLQLNTEAASGYRAGRPAIPRTPRGRPLYSVSRTVGCSSGDGPPAASGEAAERRGRSCHPEEGLGASAFGHETNGAQGSPDGLRGLDQIRDQRSSRSREPSYSATFLASCPVESTRQVAGGCESQGVSRVVRQVEAALERELRVRGVFQASLPRTHEPLDLPSGWRLPLQQPRTNQILELTRAHRRIRSRRTAAAPRSAPRTSRSEHALSATGQPSSRWG